MKDLKDLLQDTLRDIYNSENQILKALPLMQEKAHSDRLKEAFGTHLQQTREHVSRIEQVCQSLEIDPAGKVCNGTMGIIKEAQENLKEFGGSPVGDAALIADAQKVEHYEICNYGTVISWMQDLELDNELIDLLETTLDEEQETDELLSSLAEEDANQQGLSSAAMGETPKASLI